MVRFLALLSLASSLALVAAAPLQDISTTTMGVTTSPVSLDSEELIVSVERKDDILDDQGQFLAERIMTVNMRFDVQDDSVLLNGVPVGLGLNKVQIEAKVITPTVQTEEVKAEVEEALARSGIVSVQVKTSAEHITNELGDHIRRITVLERIVEIDGTTVVQTQAGQQLIDIDGFGRVTKYAPTLVDVTDLGDGSLLGSSMATCWDDAAAWWEEQDNWVRGLLSFAFGSSIFLFLWCIRKMVLATMAPAHYTPASAEDVIYYEAHEKSTPIIQITPAEMEEGLEEEREEEAVKKALLEK
ncbi:uncharacterized protein VTP21DRAFT_8804 [Calcarisporiella thermophila]|uniref:uncharacterized protein n=1 Tax=Calcarisporiella thermophila TaxID=911321 RepID=UPI0037433F4B